jgi:hypothetical protein
MPRPLGSRRVRVVARGSAFFGRAGTVEEEYPDSAGNAELGVRLDPGLFVFPAMRFDAGEVKELGDCALCGREDLTRGQAEGCEDCDFGEETA